MKSFDNEWEQIHSTSEWGAYPSEHVIRFVARRYYKLKRDEIKILDFGCGAGNHVWYLAREGFDTYGFDGSASAIKKAVNKLDKEHLQAHLQVSDALEINYEKDFFDAVIDSACIYSNKVADIKMMYHNIFEILKTGGQMLTICFGKETDGYTTGEEIENGTYVNIQSGNLAGRGTAHFFDKKEIIEIIENAGFRDISVDEVIYTDNQAKVHQYVISAVK